MSFEGHHAGHRSERVAEEIRHEVTLMLAGELKDPRLARAAGCDRGSPHAGMRTARVFVQLDGDEKERASALAGLRAASKFVRHELVERLNLRRTPEVLFLPDESEEYGQHINDLLRRVKQPENQ
jgi:ribosome-binding factor A